MFVHKSSHMSGSKWINQTNNYQPEKSQKLSAAH